MSELSPEAPAPQPTLPIQDKDATLVGRVEPLKHVNVLLPQTSGYVVEKELGRGGMGVVYRAKQSSLNRSVALKLLLSSDYAGHAELLRFKAEADAVSRLQHPNVVAIYEIGESLGKSFFSMELCLGGSLSERLATKPFQIREAVEMLLKVSRGVAAAHAAGIVHRDLKPQNVLLTTDGEPKVSDFGLAKLVGADDSNSDMTKTGVVLGTPNYMSPEQASGRSRHVGPQADVYALGIMLYELLTGRTPFRAATTLETIQLVVNEDPAPPRSVRADIPRDLEAVCLKCLAKDPQRRFKTAGELADELARFMAGEAVLTTRAGLMDKVAGALDRVQIQERFATDGNMLLALAPVMLLTEVWITYVALSGWPSYYIAAAQFARLFFFAGLIGHFRGWKIRPSDTGERHLWAVWGGYLIACSVYGLGSRLGLRTMASSLEFQFYVGWACMTGIGFMAMAATFWGYCALIGLAFFALAFIMGIDLHFAPILFGAAWFAILSLLGVRLRRLAAKPVVSSTSIASSKTEHMSV